MRAAPTGTATRWTRAKALTIGALALWGTAQPAVAEAGRWWIPDRWAMRRDAGALRQQKGLSFEVEGRELSAEAVYRRGRKGASLPSRYISAATSIVALVTAVAAVKPQWLGIVQQTPTSATEISMAAIAVLMAAAPWIGDVLRRWDAGLMKVLHKSIDLDDLGQRRQLVGRFSDKTLRFIREELTIQRRFFGSDLSEAYSDRAAKKAEATNLLRKLDELE